MIADCLSEIIERLRQLRQAVIELERENDELSAKINRNDRP